MKNKLTREAMDRKNERRRKKYSEDQLFHRQQARENYKKYRQQNLKSSAARTRMARDRFDNFKRTLKCSKCGEGHEACIEFHHRDPENKSYEIGNIRHYALSVIMKEIEKCDVLCSNCHRKLHFELNKKESEWLGGV